MSSHSCAREHSGNKRLGQSSLSHRDGERGFGSTVPLPATSRNLPPPVGEPRGGSSRLIRIGLVADDSPGQPVRASSSLCCSPETCAGVVPTCPHSRHRSEPVVASLIPALAPQTGQGVSSSGRNH